MSAKERHDAFVKAGGDGKSVGVELINAVTKVMQVANAEHASQPAPHHIEDKLEMVDQAPQGVMGVMKFAHDLAGKKYNAGYQDSVKQGSGANLSYLGEDALAKLEQSVTAIVQERDALKRERDRACVFMAAGDKAHEEERHTLRARVAELEGDVARDAARYRFWRDCWGAERFLATISSVIRTLSRPLTKGDYNNFDIVSDAAIAAAKEPSHG